jgi:hypothetical protein
MIAASGEFCPAVAMRTPMMGPVRASIACFSGPGRSSHALRCSTVLLTACPTGTRGDAGSPVGRRECSVLISKRTGLGSPPGTWRVCPVGLDASTGETR